jgi:hypothetical protein
MIKKIVAPGFLVLWIFTSFGQQVLANESIRESERKLSEIYQAFDEGITAEKRNELTEKVNEVWREILLVPESFWYPFDSLNYLGKIHSPDSLLRIYTWNLVDEKRSPLYYCFIQVRDEDNDDVRYYELNHNPMPVRDFEVEVIGSDNWYGCLYYEVIPVTAGGKTFYTLLGFDMNNFLTNKKLIDVMYWENGELKFGAPLFQLERKLQHRVIFEYSARAMMSLRYHMNHGMIIYDHLSPSQPQFTGQYQFYGPDFSFDGFIFEQQRWKQMTDIDLTNL